jgi:hypothetical protein
MRTVPARMIVAVLLLLTACGSGDSDGLPACPKPITSKVVAPGLAGQIAFKTTGLPESGYYHCSEIFVIYADGSGLRKVTTEPETYPFDVRRSPVGGMYVYWGACPDVQNFELCLVNEDGTDRRPLSAGPGHVGTTEDDSPAWSPDGSRIVFRRRPDNGPGTSSGPGDLYIVGVDGTGETQLTNEPADESQPTWSPDGQTIAYISSEGTKQVRLVKASGGPSTVLAPGGTVNESPSFSHDGRRIAFSSNRGGKPDSAYTERVRQSPGSEGLPRSGAHDIYVVGVDGKGLTRLTSDASASYSPEWSPDDRHLAFVSDRDDTHSPYVMAADGANVVRLAPLEVSSLTWFT